MPIRCFGNENESLSFAGTIYWEISVDERTQCLLLNVGRIVVSIFLLNTGKRTSHIFIPCIEFSAQAS